MFHIKIFFSFILLHDFLVDSQFHLHYTNVVSEIEHDCLRIGVDLNHWNQYHKIIYFCLSELASTFHIDDVDVDDDDDNFVQKFTFAELSQQNITSQQLYDWSTPIDIIENYQLYLYNSSLKNELFYKCTLPRFGPKCQYELQNYDLNKSLSEFIDDRYNVFRIQIESNPTSITCYTHLKCNRGLSSVCLDWSEICDGFIDCLDNGIDEENCLQIDTNDCEDDEYRCRNGQCIPKLFYKDKYITFDCIDRSDEIAFRKNNPASRFDDLPKTIFAHEDIVCERSTFTSSCDNTRYNFIIKALSSTKNNDISDTCWSAFKCFISFIDPSYLSCENYCERNTCGKIMMDSCPEFIYFPSAPVLFGDLYSAFITNESYYGSTLYSVPFYICYNNSLYDNNLAVGIVVLVNNMTCIKRHSGGGGKNPPASSIYELYSYVTNSMFQSYKKYYQVYKDTFVICNISRMYRCASSSKCISIYRIKNDVSDCPYQDDENFNMNNNSITWMDRLRKTVFKCELNDKYIANAAVENGGCDCPLTNKVCEDEHLDLAYAGKNILFKYICDGLIDIVLPNITRLNQSDETECQQWQCDNIYTHCDGEWNCPDGADEADCFFNSTLECSSNQHLCVSFRTTRFICLSMDKMNDSIVDCLGATDEPSLMCESGSFYCRNQNTEQCVSIYSLCNDQNDCNHGDDEQFCETSSTDANICSIVFDNRRTNIEQYFCSYNPHFHKRIMKYFKLHEMITSVKHQTKNIQNTIFSTSSLIQTSNQHHQHCHRGLQLLVWLNNKNKTTRNTCLCMPSYYGPKCQYQNQRVNLIIKFQASSDSRDRFFSIIIKLIDDSNERVIHSYEQVTYLAIRDCKTKFNIYLLYSTRPKSLTKQYAIHIDIYEKQTFIYRGSYLFQMKYSFLPVHHLPMIVNIPSVHDKVESCYNDECIHGECIKYLDNSNNLSFCQCDEGWRGKYCTIEYGGKCSPGSFCVDIDAKDRSICICPMNKFGPRCLLTNEICSNNNRSRCENGGECIVNDDYLISNQSFSCICPKNVTGDRCEITETKLVISFDKSISLSQEMFIHFIEISSTIVDFESTVRSTTFRSIFSDRNLFTIYWSQVFHLVFVELNKTYCEDSQRTSREREERRRGSNQAVELRQSSDRKVWLRYFMALCV